MEDVQVRVAEIEQLTADIKKFVLVDPDGKDLPEFEAGAHVDVMTGNGLRRSYSLANDPAERGRYVTAVLREPEGGGGSKWMHDELALGDALTLKGPRNNFPLAEDATEHLLIAGGIGITPILAMGYALKARGADFTLHYCTKTPEATAFKDEVDAVFGGNVIYHHDGGDPKKGIKLDQVLADYRPGRHLYLCGPGGLITAAREAASHWPPGTVHFELFSSTRSEEETAEILDHAGDQPFEVELRQSGKTITIPADKSILEVLEEDGYSLDFMCREGYCATCVTDLISGAVDHRDQILTDDEKAANDKILICVSRALPGEKLVLDL